MLTMPDPKHDGTQNSNVLGSDQAKIHNAKDFFLFIQKIYWKKQQRKLEVVQSQSSLPPASILK